MTRLTITKSEILLLGILVLLTALVALVPWKKLVLEYREYEAGKYDYSRAVEEGRREAKPPPPDWQLKTEYSSDTGALRLTLNHEYIKPSRDLRVFAEFTSGRSGSPVVETFLHNHSGGVYGMQDLHLPKGEWVMSLTGYQNLEFVFRREEILKVE